MFRVDLTTASNGDSSLLRRHLQELLRRIKRQLGYTVETFVVETSEGNGVLHMVWAIQSKLAVWIPQDWLSREWLKIHGASVVWIRRMGGGEKDSKRVASYFIRQYLAGQSSLVRFSWSWWKSRLAIGKSWQAFKREVRKCSTESTWVGENPYSKTINRTTMIEGWKRLLMTGSCIVGDIVFFINGRELDWGVRV